MKLSLSGLEETAITEVRAILYDTYKQQVNGNEVANTVVTAENIHKVKVLLLGPYMKLGKDGAKWTASAFKILPPYMLPTDLERGNAQAFFEKVKESR
jgi:hypothetical protein